MSDQIETNPIFDTLHHDDEIRIYTYHSFEADTKKAENLDFFVEYKGKHYACTAFSLDSIIAFKKDKSTDVFNSYFWAPYTIIIKEFSSTCLIEAVLDIIRDDISSFEDILCLQR